MKTIARRLFFALLVSVAGFAFAQAAPMPGAERQQQMLKGLGLTQDQVTQVTDLFAKNQAANQTKRAQIKVLQAQIELGMTQPTTDLKALNALVDQKVALQADIEKQFLALASQVHQIVGDPAYAKLQAKFLSMSHHRGMMGRPGPKGANPPPATR